MGGVQVGYDTQFSPNWVFGIEANYSFLDTGSNPSSTAASVRSPAASATPGVRRCCTSRAAMPGPTRASPTASAADFPTAAVDGYTVGGGLEYLFTQNWSGKIEYQYYDFGTRNARSPSWCCHRSAASATTSTPSRLA